MSHNNNRQSGQLPQVFARLGRATPPRQNSYNSGRYYNSQQPPNDVGFRFARPHHTIQQPNGYHYNNMGPNNMNFQPPPPSANFYSGFNRGPRHPQQDQASQHPYFPNNNTIINTNSRMNNSNFRPDSSASSPTPPTPPLPPAPSGSTGNTNSFSFVKNVHKDPAASDLIISFVRNDSSASGSLYPYQEQETILQSPPTSTVPSPSISNNSDHLVVDYHTSSSRRNNDSDHEEDYPSHRDIIAKSIQITASRPLGSDKNGIANSSSHTRRDNRAPVHDDQPQSHSDLEMNHTAAVNRKVTVNSSSAEKRDCSYDEHIVSSKRSKLLSRSISPSPVRDKRRRSLSRESQEHHYRKQSRRHNDSEEDDDDRKRGVIGRAPSPVSPRRRYRSRRESTSSSDYHRKRTSLSPFSGRRRRSLTPGSSSDEDNAPFLRHEADRYIPDYNRRPLPRQHRSRGPSNDNIAPAAVIKKPAAVSKPAPVDKPTLAAKSVPVAKPVPATKPAPTVTNPAAVPGNPTVKTKPSASVTTAPPTSTPTKKAPVVAPTASSSSIINEKGNNLASAPPLGTAINTTKASVTTTKQLLNFPPLGTTSNTPAPLSVTRTKDLRDFPPLGTAASPKPKELLSFSPLSHQMHDSGSYPSTASPTSSSPARASYSPSPSTFSGISTPSRSYNRVWTKPTTDVTTTNGQQDAIAHNEVPVTAKPTPSPPIANNQQQQTKTNGNDTMVLAKVKQEPVSDTPVTKPAPSTITHTQVNMNVQVTLSDPAVLNVPFAGSSCPTLPPPLTTQAQNTIQTQVINDTTTTPAVYVQPSAINSTEQRATIGSAQVTTQQKQITETVEQPLLSKAARNRRARKQRQMEQNRLLAIEERDDVVVDVLPVSTQQQIEEDEDEDEATLNADAVPQQSVENVIANQPTPIESDNNQNATDQPVTQNQSDATPILENQQQEVGVPTPVTTPAAETEPVRPARRRRLPSPWKVKMSEIGDIYYHNPITGQDTWIRPE